MHHEELDVEGFFLPEYDHLPTYLCSKTRMAYLIRNTAHVHFMTFEKQFGSSLIQLFFLHGDTGEHNSLLLGKRVKGEKLRSNKHAHSPVTKTLL